MQCYVNIMARAKAKSWLTQMTLSYSKGILSLLLQACVNVWLDMNPLLWTLQLWLMQVLISGCSGFLWRGEYSQSSVLCSAENSAALGCACSMIVGKMGREGTIFLHLHSGMPSLLYHPSPSSSGLRIQLDTIHLTQHISLSGPCGLSSSKNGWMIPRSGMWVEYTINSGGYRMMSKKLGSWTHP